MKTAGIPVVVTAIVLFFAFLVSCAAPSVTARYASGMARRSGSHESTLLQYAFRCKSVEKKREFFTIWKSESDSLRKRFDTSDRHLSDINAIFIDLYAPDTMTFKQYVAQSNYAAVSDSNKKAFEDIIRFSRGTTGFPRDAGYIVVQGSVRYSVYSNAAFDSLLLKNIPGVLPSCIRKDTVDGFAPNVRYFDKKVLYCTKKYTGILEVFFSGRYDGRIAEPYRNFSKNSTEKRNFLMPEVEFSVRQADRDTWHYIVFPEVLSIGFNEAFDKAKVDFRSTWYSGGSAVYEKEEGKWVKKECNPNEWME